MRAEVDPLACRHCGREMKVVSIIEPPQADVIEKIMRHCGLWNPPPPRPPPAGGCPVDDPAGARGPDADGSEHGERTYVDMDTFWATF